MVIFKTTSGLLSFLQKARLKSNSIGFVPTMGALHEGHLSLIRQSLRHTEVTVCSIFVNPTQFNNPEDFKHYPITIERDIEKLIASGCHILFLPPVAEIYPSGHQKKQFDLGPVERVLEGAHRPGHFQGVCEVVDRLLQLVGPNHLFMGQKDYQQCMVIARLLSLTDRENTVQLHVEPTLREADGLAMSSRNQRLSPSQRSAAVVISQCLTRIKTTYREETPETLKQDATLRLKEAGFTVDYVEICNAHTLQPVLTQKEPAVALIAAALGPVRLIDNMLLN